MNQPQKILSAAMAVMMALSVMGCGAGEDQTGASFGDSKTLWVEDNFTDPQEGYSAERPSIDYFAAAQLSSSGTMSRKKQHQPQEIKAVWLSYLDLKPMLLNSSDKSVGKKQFERNIDKAFNNIKNLGLNTVIAQVRPFGDALYESEYFPWSYLAAGTEGKDPGFDPLQIMVSKAHKKGLRLEAWVNPYRVRNGTNSKPISKDNPVNAMIKSKDAVKYGSSLTYDPASPKAQALIVNGVEEIVKNYDVDGIHFDDYFYPTTDKAFDAASYQKYKKSGGKKSLAAWRRSNVDSLVKKVYSKIKSIDRSVQFGISPQGNMDNNYNKQFIDVKKWLSHKGYIDYICPQIYFGFDNKTCPYEKTVKQWNSMIKNNVDLYVGLSPYKIGLEDTYAGNGKWEWTHSGDILTRMVETAREAKHYEGFAMFRYDSLFRPSKAVRGDVSKEMESLKEIL